MLLKCYQKFDEILSTFWFWYERARASNTSVIGPSNILIPPINALYAIPTPQTELLAAPAAAPAHFVPWLKLFF